MAEIKYFTCAETAREVRKALKENFSGVKFSVRSHTYAGGASITVHYNDPNVSDSDVREVTVDFAGSSFDPMRDLHSYHDSYYNGQTVRWGADFVFVHNDGKVWKSCEFHPYFDCACEAA